MKYPPQHPTPHSPAAPAGRGIRAGLVAVILVAAALAIQLGMTLVTASFIASTDRSSFDAYGLVSTLELSAIARS